MRIKHFAGYGQVTAKKISKTTDPNGFTILSILVEGDHEQGLAPGFILDGVNYGIDYTLKKWLLDRFDKSVKDAARLDGNVNVDHFSYTACRYDFIYQPNTDKINW